MDNLGLSRSSHAWFMWLNVDYLLHQSYIGFLLPKYHTCNQHFMTCKSWNVKNEWYSSRIGLCWHNHSNHIKMEALLQKQLDEVSLNLPRTLFQIQQIRPWWKGFSGTFFSLEQLYIRTEMEKNIEMRYYKLHLHARWAIKGILSNRKSNLYFLIIITSLTNWLRRLFKLNLHHLYWLALVMYSK